MRDTLMMVRYDEDLKVPFLISGKKKYFSLDAQPEIKILNELQPFSTDNVKIGEKLQMINVF